MKKSPSQLSGPMIVLACSGAVVSTFSIVGYAIPRFVKTTLPAFAPTPPPIPPILFTTGALYAPADHDRLMKIGTALYEKKPIADADLDWAIGLLQHGPVIDSAFTRSSFALRTMSQLGNRRSMTPAQSRRLARAVLPYADDPLPKERAPIETETGQLQSTAVSVQSVALITLASLDDGLGREKLKSLAQSSATPKIRNEAEKLLKKQRERNAKPPTKK